MCISSGKAQDRYGAGLGHCPWVFSPLLVFQSPAVLWCNPGLEEGGTKWPLRSRHAVPDTQKCGSTAIFRGPTAQKRLKSCLPSFTPVNNTQHPAPVALPQAVSLPGHYLAIQTRLGRCWRQGHLRAPAMPRARGPGWELGAGSGAALREQGAAFIHADTDPTSSPRSRAAAAASRGASGLQHCKCSCPRLNVRFGGEPPAKRLRGAVPPLLRRNSLLAPCPLVLSADRQHFQHVIPQEKDSF